VFAAEIPQHIKCAERMQEQEEEDYARLFAQSPPYLPEPALAVLIEGEVFTDSLSSSIKGHFHLLSQAFR
jgi:hypothetical protein